MNQRTHLNTCPPQTVPAPTGLRVGPCASWIFGGVAGNNLLRIFHATDRPWPRGIARVLPRRGLAGLAIVQAASSGEPTAGCAAQRCAPGLHPALSSNAVPASAGHAGAERPASFFHDDSHRPSSEFLHCQWMERNPDDRDPGWCKEPALHGHAWCAGHKRRVYIPPLTAEELRSLRPVIRRPGLALAHPPVAPQYRQDQP